MTQIETEAPPAYSPYERIATAGQTGADSDTSNLMNHINITINLARDIYRSCIKNLEAFSLVAREVAALFALLEIMRETVADHGVSHEMVESTTKLLSASKNLVSNIRTLVTRYEDLPIASQRVWEHTMEGATELVDLQRQLDRTIDSFSAYNKSIISTSPKGVLAMAHKFMSEVERGQRNESIMSKKGFASLDMKNTNTRLQIQQDLEDVGITSHLFEQFHDIIFQTLGGIVDKSSSLGPSYTPTPGITKSSTFGTKQDLFRAISRDDLPRVQELLDQGLDIESRDSVNGGQTPLIVAVGYDKVDIVELLLLRGANANAKTLHSEETALISASSSGRYQIILWILEHGNPDLEARDRNGRTALMRASAQGYTREVQVLVKAGADIEAKDRNGRTALMEASRLDHDPTVKLLMKLGAKNNQ